MPFAGDTAEKQRQASEKLRRAAERHLGEIYRRLEAAALDQAERWAGSGP
jgi:hypothetical protein